MPEPQPILRPVLSAPLRPVLTTPHSAPPPGS